LLPSVQYRSGRSLAALTFAFETYREHVERVLAHARQWLSQHPVAVDLLAAKLHATPDLIRGAVILGAGLHDVGKLDERWQGVAWAWQDHKGGPPRRRPFLAHTDYDPGSDAQDQARAEFRRPPHAVEGALAVLSIVDSWLQDLGCLDQAAGEALWRCVVSAISRHHAARAHNCGGFRWSRDAWTEALEPLLDGIVPRPGTSSLSRTLGIERSSKRH
jgi:hypothetical protein